MFRFAFLGRRTATGLAVAALALAGSGCTTAGALFSVAGITTDTSMTWTVVKYFHGQLTEGDERACVKLDSVQRALATRCGAFVPGSIDKADLQRPDQVECALAVAIRDPQLWPVAPELLAKGASTAACHEAPLVQLAWRLPCPDFQAASPASLSAISRLAMTDPRSVHHDAMRMLSCPNAHAAGLDLALTDWRTRGLLKPGMLGFSPLSAMHPQALAGSALARDLEADGHTAQAALGGYDGRLGGGFEEALRTSEWSALEWWLQRTPELANRVPPSQGNQLSWLPLARVLVPNFLEHPESRRDMVEFLMARGADPRRRLPSNDGQSVIGFAKQLKSPLVAVLEAPPAPLDRARFAAAPQRAPRSGE